MGVFPMAPARWPRKLAVVWIGLSFVPCGAVAAQEPVVLSRLVGEITLDGLSNEPAWQTIAPLPLTMFQPSAGARPTDSSEIRLTYDEQHLYVAGRFFVADPSQVRSSSLSRDRLSADDVFRLLLDTFNDNENAVVFATTPAGVQVDYAVSGDGTTTNDSWNTYWSVATTRTEAGWFAEMRIPLSSLRFQSVGDRVTMGLIVSRFSAQKNELSTFPAVSPRYANAVARPSIARKIVLEHVRTRKPLYFTPYALGGLNQVARLNPSATAFERTDSGSTELGGDVKFGMTSNLTLDLTVNTDFAQVEADDQQVNLTRFSLFFPEKRQFFQERAGIFTVATGAPLDPSLFFHSRRIGLTDDGRPVRIYGGTRLVGRVGDWDIGGLDMQTATDERSATENLGALRLRRRAFNDQSTIGAIATTRLGGGPNNVAYGFDSRVRTVANEYLTVQWGQSFDEDLRLDGIRSGMARIAWDRPGTLTSQGVAYQASLKWSGRDFNPGLGFQPRSDFTHAFVNARYGWFPGGSTAIRVLQPSVALSTYRRNSDGTAESVFLGSFLNYEMKSGVNGWVGWNHSVEELAEPLQLSPTAVVPPGRHAYDSFEGFLFPPDGSSLRTGLSVEVGKFYDGTQFSFGLTPTWTLSEHLELGLDYRGHQVRFSNRGQRFDADIVRLRVTAALNTKISASTFVQYNEAADAVVGNLRVRYRFAEGRDLYLVYNERLNTDRDRLVPSFPRLPASQERTLLVKYTYTLAR